MELTSFEQRQKNLVEMMEPGLAIIPAANFVTKSNDTEFPFRQDSNFKYFLGSNEPEATLVIKKFLDGSSQSTLFLRDNDEFAEMWMGKRLGVAKAAELLPIDETNACEEFETQLPELMKNTHKIYFDLYNAKVHSQVLSALKRLESLRKAKVHRPQGFVHLTPMIGKLRLVKDQNELTAMRQAAALTDLGFRAAMSFSAPGKNEKDVSRLLDMFFTRENGEGHAYDAIVAGGTNALVLHYISNNCELKSGDWLLIDAGSQVNLYASDVTRTFPVNGKYTPEQKDLYQVILESQMAGLNKAKIGGTIAEVHHETTRVLVQALIDHKVLEGSVDGIIEEGAHRAYYPHGTSHWLGLDVHDNSPYKNVELEDIAFESGMVFTCEPGLYFKENDPKVPSYWKGLGIRTEDDILITEQGYENLTRAIPKGIKEIEEACAVDFAEFSKLLF